MFKTIFNTFFIFTSLLCTIVAFAWMLNYFDYNEWDNHLIPVVQADYTPKTLPQSQTKSAQAFTPTLEPSVLPEAYQIDKRIEIKFPPDAKILTVNERKKLDGILKGLEIDANQEVRILATPAPLKRDTVSSSHAAKLRAQSVARVIYPYTQHIDISYHAKMPPNQIIIEFP